MGTYTYSGSTVQTATVNTAGTYDIVGYGGRGGNSSNDNTTGGGGAEAGGDFALTAGEKLKIVVGGHGGDSDYGGGGGGTFVLGEASGASSYTLLVAAGGGGGAYSDNGGAGSATAAAGTGAGGTAGGTYAGAGGAGFKSSGASDAPAQQPFTAYGGSSGPSYAGGSSGFGSGGFGGGGAAGLSGGGGGGGYTGGNGGYINYENATGGTSFLAALADNNNTVKADGQNTTGAGFVTITPNVCYVSGTLIRTTRGDVAVEALQLGDLVVTASGAHRPIRWLGHRDTDCARHPEPRRVWPVRVAAGALGGGLPYADLWLSPGHALCLDDVLYPVRALVHGDLIQQVEQDHVTYWHVELDSHDILVANGVQAESYLDTGNRSAFDNAPGVVDLHPDFEPRFTERFCRPYAESGPLVAAARYRLFGAAQTPATPTVHLVADGLVLTPARCGNTLTFVVPERTRQLRLASPSRRANGADVRTLGVLIGSIVIETSAGRHDITLDDPRLFAGFHEVERTSAGSWRWTDGAGHFASDLWSDADGPFLMRLTGLFDRAEEEGPERIAA